MTERRSNFANVCSRLLVFH
uniref:Uncharacterized protein n=1 Tax=Anguilla anguilla TaxID=7936 RepID=A0A0E9TT23_ANGAN